MHGVTRKVTLAPFGKRLFDLLISSAGLLLCLPLLMAVYFLIKVTSPGPVLYCSWRLGYQGKLFKCWKLRSMHPDADERLESLLKNNPLLKQEWERYRKLRDDPRLTPLGRLLRSTSIDELPQLWNVLVGDLSIVGPRPYLPKELPLVQRMLKKNAARLFSVRPGITGLWQTAGRSELTFEQRVRLEMRYVNEHSFLWDLWLLLKTGPILFLRKGAF